MTFASVSWDHLKGNYLAKPNPLLSPGGCKANLGPRQEVAVEVELWQGGLCRGGWANKVEDRTGGEGGVQCCSRGVRVTVCQQLRDPEAEGRHQDWDGYGNGKKVGMGGLGRGKWKLAGELSRGKNLVKSQRGKEEVGLPGRQENGVPVYQPP